MKSGSQAPHTILHRVEKDMGSQRGLGLAETGKGCCPGLDWAGSGAGNTSSSEG